MQPPWIERQLWQRLAELDAAIEVLDTERTRVVNQIDGLVSRSSSSGLVLEFPPSKVGAAGAITDRGRPDSSDDTTSIS